MTRKRTVLLCLAVLLITVFSASAEVWNFPGDLEVIGEEAFAGVTYIESLTLPDSLLRIEKNAFAGSTIDVLFLPDSIRYIDPDAFIHAVIGKVTATPGTYAYQWALDNGYISIEHVDMTLTADAQEVQSGEPITWTVILPEEETDFAYRWIIAFNNEILITAETAAPTYTFAPVKTGTYTMTASIVSGYAEGSSDPLLFTAVPRTGETAASDFTYQILDEQTIKITKYTGAEPHVVIPEVIDGYTVRTIDNNAFLNNKTIVSVHLPDTVTSIGNSAFQGCTSLQAAELSEGLKTLGNSVFNGCVSIKELDLPDGLESVGNSTFTGMTNLIRADLPDSVTHLGSSAFKNCEQLASFHYPLNLATTGGGSIFTNCKALKTIAVTEGVTALPANIFASAGCLEEVNLPTTLKTIGNSAFSGCVLITELDLPDGLESVGNSAFAGMTNLVRADLPDSVTHLGKAAFQNCEKLASFHYPLNLATTGGAKIFENCRLLTSFTIPEGVTALPDSLFNGANYVEEVHLPTTLEKIGNSAFAGCALITELDLPDGLTDVGPHAFSGMTNLLSADLPDSVTRIGDNAFENCEKLAYFHYPLSLQAVYNGYLTYGNLFLNCQSLKEITVPEGVTELPFCVFRGSNLLEHIYLPSTLKTIGAFAFHGCELIEELDIPSGVTEIGGHAFAGMKKLTTADLPDGVVSIGQCAYSGCENLTYFHYPLSLDHTAPYNHTCGSIFENCFKLESITIPDGVTHIPGSMFHNAQYLKNVDIPMSVTEIGYPVTMNNKDAFYDCKSIEVLYLSENINKIYDNTFEGCASLEIWTEYATYALNYAMNKSIPYYYLTPVRVGVPMGTLYKGDKFTIHGYARSSINLTEVTATIWDSSGNVVQTITIDPETTDYDLAGGINRSLHFETLECGSYRFTMRAATEKSEENWFDTAFSIVPPPLRIYLSNAKLPEDVIDISSGYSISGTILSNYPVTNVTATITNAKGTEVRSASAAPGTLSFDISSLSGNLNIAGLIAGEYSLTIRATAKGETRVLAGTNFEPYNLAGVIDDEIATEIVKFASVYKNKLVFDGNYTSEAISSFSTADMFFMAVNTRTKWITDTSTLPKAVRYFLHIPVPDVPSSRMVDLYENELAAIIAELDYGTIESILPEMNHTAKFIYDCIKDGNEIINGLVEQYNLDGLINDEMSNERKEFFKENVSQAFKGYTDTVKVLKDTVQGYTIAADYANSVTNIYCNYIKGMYIIACIADSVDEGDNPEMQIAVERLGAKYKSLTVNVFLNGFEQFYNWALKEGFKELTKALFEEVSGVAFADANFLYTVINLSVDIAMEVSGKAAEASAHEDFITQLDCFNMAVTSYRNAFDTVYEGDHSKEALNRLTATFLLTKSACIKAHQTMLTMGWVSPYEDKYTEISTYIEKIENTKIY